MFDNIVHLYTLSFARTRLHTIRRKQEKEPDQLHEEDKLLLHFMDFQKYLTQSLQCDATHVTFDRNPGGRATSIHFYRNGEFVDSYYHEYFDETEMLDRLQKPNQIGRLMGGRFAFLNELPIILERFGERSIEYFHGSNLPPNKGEDIFGLNQTDLYVPFWEEDTLPISAIYVELEEQV